MPPTKNNEQSRLEEAAAELFQVAPEGFVAARDALAARLRARGDAALARRVRRLRKPPVAVWALNQLARRHPGEIEALVEAGDRLRETQRRVLAGEPSAGALAGARAAERAHAGRLLHHAQALLAEAGHAVSGRAVEQISKTLQAIPAAGDEDRARLRMGRLRAPLTPAAFGELLGTLAPTRDRRAVRGRGAPPAPSPRAVGAPERDGQAEAAARRRAAQAVRQARGALERARTRRERAAREEKSARGDLRRVEVRARQAREALARADGELASAQARLDELERAAGLARRSFSGPRGPAPVL